MTKNYVGFFCGTGYITDNIMDDGVIKKEVMLAYKIFARN